MSDIEVEGWDGKMYPASFKFGYGTRPYQVLVGSCGPIGFGALIWVAGIMLRDELRFLGYTNVKVRAAC